MPERKKFYITTPIYYVNDVPHIGHAYATIAADVLARYHRLMGDDVFFLTGVDENSQKNIEAANNVGKENDVQGYLDEMSAKWQFAWKTLGITNDDFIRTTEARHKKGVLEFVERVYKKGDIYFGTYEGLYCPRCEEFKTETDAPDGLCPIHQVKLDHLTEKNYFFKLTKYRDALLKHFEEHPDFVQPLTRRNEILNYIKDHLTDMSITRSTMQWGIAMPELEPGMSKNVIYVWFDALINYLTAVGFGSDEKRFDTLWPAQLHLVGKDILKFHAALWPAMLMSADLPLPEHVFAHGFFTINNQKMGKSAGNAVDPYALIKTYGNDALRYFLLREIPFGKDGDFSEEKLKDRFNGDLAHGLGNLVSRTLAMVEKYCDGVIPNPTTGGFSDEIKKQTIAAWDIHAGKLSQFKLDEALVAVQVYIGVLNLYIDMQKPWQLAKEKSGQLGQVLFDLCEGLRSIALMLAPFMPDAANAIHEQLGLGKILSYEHSDVAVQPGAKISKGDNLFPVIE